MVDDTPNTTDDEIDPDEIEPLSDSEGVYQRDGDGEFKPLDWRVIEYANTVAKIRLYPIPTGDVEELQELGTDIDMSVLCEILVDKVHTPDRTEDEWLDTDPRQVSAIVEELAGLAGGPEPNDEFHRQVREDLAEREAAGTAGN